MKNNSDKFPTKKDMTYWIVMIVILLTVVSVWKTNDPETLTNQLSLGGTLLSIFLAIIAIIFSFVQSSDANSHNEKMIDKMAELTESIRILDIVNKEKTEKAATVSSEINNMKTLLDNMKMDVTSMQEQPSDDLQIINKNLNVLAQKIEDTQKNISQNDLAFEIKIYGKNALYNFLISKYGIGEIVYLRNLRSDFNKDNNMEISEHEMRKTLNQLHNDGKVVFLSDNTGTFIQIK